MAIAAIIEMSAVVASAAIIEMSAVVASPAIIEIRSAIGFGIGRQQQQHRRGTQHRGAAALTRSPSRLMICEGAPGG